MKHVLPATLLFLLTSPAVFAQAPDSTPPQPQQQPQASSPEGGRRQGRGGQMEGRGTIGKIASLTANSAVVTRPDGTSVTVKLSDKTEFRKDRQPAKLSDFKVGDFVMVRGDENSDHSITAQVFGGRSANAGPGGARGGGGMLGEMGRDFVAGQIKSVDAPKLTILRTDNVTQTLELNEQTSLRRGRDSITMADIQPGDHVIVRGGLENNSFVPKTVILVSPEQWERMQQFAQGANGPAAASPGVPPAGAPSHP